MRVTVQNGARHGLSRLEVEAIVPLFPASWSKRVDQIVLYQSVFDDLTVSYHPQQRVMGLHGPRPKEASTKEEGVQELLVAMSVVAELGELPQRLTNPMRRRHLEAVEALVARCMSVMADR